MHGIYATQQPVGSTSDFALDNSPFHQAYDMSAPALFPQNFYTKQTIKELQPITEHRSEKKEEHELMTRVFLGSMTVVGLFIFFRCVVR